MMSFLGRQITFTVPMLVLLVSCGGSGSKRAATDAGDTGEPDAAEPSAQIGDGIEGEHASDQSGASIALSGDGSRIVIGASGNDDSGDAAGHARVFQRQGNAWVQLGQDLDGEAADDRFGGSVAISDDGNRVAVGSYLNDGAGAASGHVRVFELEGSSWVQVGADIDGPPGRGAGWAVSMSANGQRVVIGGPTPNAGNGVVTVYEEQGGAWSLVGDILEGNYEFGHAVTMSDNGNRIALSFPGAQGNSRPGTAQVFDWSGTAWTQLGADLVGEGLGDNFGTALSLSGDGATLAVGAASNVGLGAAGGGGKGGSVRVFRLAAGAWTQLGQGLDGEPGSNYGSSVALSEDGTRLVVGGRSGSVARLYLWGNDTWTVSDTPDFGSYSRNGESVAISSDGKVGASGATYFRGMAGSATGVVHVFKLP